VIDHGNTSRESRLSRRVRRDFPEPGSADEVLRLLSGLVWFPDHPAHSERVQAAVVILARGNVGRLKANLSLATTDWRDVLVAAGLANEDWPSRLDAELGADS
jgi:hypothetical protein